MRQRWQELYDRAQRKDGEGDHHGAIRDFSEVLSLHPNHFETYWGRGCAKHALGNFSEAIEDYSSALKLSPRQGDIHLNRGDAFFELKDYKSAITDYEEALKRGLNFPSTHLSIGMAWSELGKMELALDHLKEAIKQNPNYVDARIQRACIYLNQGKDDLALQDLVVAIRQAPSSPECYVLRGHANYNLGKYKLAVDDYEQALKLDPAQTDAFEGLVGARSALGHTSSKSDHHSSEPASSTPFASPIFSSPSFATPSFATTAASPLGSPEDKQLYEWWHAADRAYAEGRYDEAEMLLVKSVELSESFGETDSRLYRSIDHLARVYGNALHDWEKVEKLYARLLQIAEKKNDPRALAYVYLNNATVFAARENYKKAIEFYRRCIDTYQPTGRTTVGDPVDFASTEDSSSLDYEPLQLALCGLGVCHSRLFDFGTAEKYYSKALTLAESRGGPLDIASARKRLGVLYLNQSRYNEAFELLVLACRSYHLNGQDEDLAECREYLGNVHCKLSRFEEAAKCFADAFSYFKDRTDYTSKWHLPDLFLRLAHISILNGNYAEAETYHHENLKCAEDGPRAGKEDMRNYKSGLADFYKRTGRYILAEDFYRVADDEYDVVDHYKVSYAEFCITMARYDEAFKILSECAHYEKTYGPADEKSVGLMTAMADWHKTQGHYKKAHSLLAQAIRLTKSAHGKDSLYEACIHVELANLLLAQNGNAEQAEKYIRAASTIVDKHCAPNCLTVLNIKIELGRAQYVQGAIGEARANFLDALCGQRQVLEGEDNPLLAETHHYLSAVYLKEKNYDDCENSLDQAIRSRQKHLGTDHPQTLSSLATKASLLAAQRRHEDAEQILMDVLIGRRKHLPSDHPAVIRTLESLARLLRKLDRDDEADVLKAEAETLEAVRSNFADSGAKELK